MKRGLSIFTLLGGSVLIGCLTMGIALFLLHKSHIEGQDNRQLDNAFTLNRALLQAVVNGHLQRLDAQLTALVNQEELDFAHSDELEREARMRLSTLLNQGQARNFDRVILASTDGQRCSDLGDPFYRGDCRELIQQYGSDLRPWHLYHTYGKHQQTGLLTRRPLTNHSGAVIGYLYVATVLTDNFAILNEVNMALGKVRQPMALVANNGILANNVRLNAAQRLAIHAALVTPEEPVQTDRYFAQADELWLAKRPVPIKIVSLIPIDEFHEQSTAQLNQTLSAILMGSLLAILLSMLATRLTLSPLLALVRYVRSEVNDRPAPVAGHIREINQISSFITEHIDELKQSQQQLRQYGKELAATHEEVQRSNLDLHRQTQSLEQTNQRLEALMTNKKALLHQLFHLQEEERKHLAQELHDDLGQTLAAVSTEAHLIMSQLPADAPLHPQLKRINDYAKEMYDVVYNRIISLRPLPLNDLGVSEAIRHMPLLQQLEQQGCAIELDLPQLPRLKGEIEISLFRITQESLNNCYKHAKATQLVLSLQYHDGALRLLIRDNGCGFNLAPQSSPTSFGISGMRERCHAINGHFHIESSPNGTTVLAEIPIQADCLFDSAESVQAN